MHLFPLGNCPPPHFLIVNSSYLPQQMVNETKFFLPSPIVIVLN